MPELGQYRLAELDRDAVQDMIERMLSGDADDGSARSRHRQSETPSPPCAQCGATLPRASRNPATRWRARTARIPKGRDRYATPGEAATLLAVLPARTRRSGEPRSTPACAAASSWAFARVTSTSPLGVIRVEQAYDARSKEIIPPKSYAGRRKVPVAGLLRDPLVDARVRASERGLELVFGRDDGRPFSYNGLLDRAKRIWNSTVCDPIGLHECRHTFASLMIAAMSDAGRFNPKVLQTLMGHASITETYDRYGHLMPGSENEAAGMLDRYLAAAADAVRAAGETAAAGKVREKLWRCGKVSSGPERTPTRAS